MDKVPIANRYNGAWAEINARLQARQNVNITFTTIAAAAIAAMWSERSYYGAVYFFLPFKLDCFVAYAPRNDTPAICHCEPKAKQSQH